ncbi:hypothetical protein MNV49_006889 [Pseudohyphozyma bogoriensis]|nr:hypothetical protein MNV49_006889 [Pseudohyphozyma bogoriensis]
MRSSVLLTTFALASLSLGSPTPNVDGSKAVQPRSVHSRREAGPAALAGPDMFGTDDGPLNGLLGDGGVDKRGLGLGVGVDIGGLDVGAGVSVSGSGISVGAGVSVKKCPTTFVCNGKGTDGYDYDTKGNGVPSGYPSSFKYFGVAVGWQPVAGWDCGATWSAPSAWLSVCAKATWWTPPEDWVYPSGFTVPSFWKKSVSVSTKWPSASWTCSGSGSDGYDYDDKGNTCPYAGLGWKWFGVSIGWAPPKAWTPPSNSWTPPSGWAPAKCTWWAPPTTWTCPSSITPPSFWCSTFKFCPSSGSTTVHVGWPSISWTCSGSGSDGYKWDYKGNTCPYAGLDWQWFGNGIGWAPPKGWTPPSNSWTPPSGWKPSSCTWWAPPTTWTCPSSIAPPTFWCSKFHYCPGSHTTTTTPCDTPTPSHKYGNGKGKGKGKRSATICAAAHTACLVSGSASSYECINTSTNLEQCGGCADSGGRDCTTIAGVESVSCLAGECVIDSCSSNLVVSYDRGSCVSA